jgi:hypothetical protein
MTVPKEDQEAEMLSNWLKANWYRFTHIWNESWQRGTKNIVIMMTKKKRLGVSPWFPDYCICLKRGAIMFIELKRQRRTLKSGKMWSSPSVISKEQTEWIESLNAIKNIQAEICYWFQHAIEMIEKIENI